MTNQRRPNMPDDVRQFINRLPMDDYIQFIDNFQIGAKRDNGVQGHTFITNTGELIYQSNEPHLAWVINKPNEPTEVWVNGERFTDEECEVLTRPASDSLFNDIL